MDKLCKLGLVASISKLQQSIDNFSDSADHHALKLTPEEWAMDGDTIRRWQQRLNRIKHELDDLYRRIDT